MSLLYVLYNKYYMYILAAEALCAALLLHLKCMYVYGEVYVFCSIHIYTLVFHTHIHLCSIHIYTLAFVLHTHIYTL